MNCVLTSDNILYDTLLFRVIYEWVGGLLPCGLSYAVSGIAIMMLLVNGVLLGLSLIHI